MHTLELLLCSSLWREMNVKVSLLSWGTLTHNIFTLYISIAIKLKFTWILSSSMSETISPIKILALTLLTSQQQSYNNTMCKDLMLIM